MFNVTEEISLGDFKAWSGGKDRLDKAIKLDVTDELEEYIAEMYGCDFTDGELNDILWFEIDDFLESLEEDND